MATSLLGYVIAWQRHCWLRHCFCEGIRQNKNRHNYTQLSCIAPLLSSGHDPFFIVYNIIALNTDLKDANLKFTDLLDGPNKTSSDTSLSLT